MKTKLFIAAILLTASTFAEKVKESEVPAKVKEAFAKKYAGAKADKWEKENTEYEVKFTFNKVESEAKFDAEGAFKAVEQELKSAEVPKQIVDYCTANFKEFKLDEVSKVVDAAGKVSYEAELKKGKGHFDAIFD